MVVLGTLNRSFGHTRTRARAPFLPFQSEVYVSKLPMVTPQIRFERLREDPHKNIPTLPVDPGG